MFYELLYPLREYWFLFNVFRYITFRASMAAVTAFLVCLIFGPFLLRLLKNLNFGQVIRQKHVESIYPLHKDKEGTPTMGGVIIVLGVLISTILWGRLDNKYVILSVAGLLWLGIIGFLDDLIKIKKGSSDGLRAKTKLAGQTVIALVVGLFVLRSGVIGTELYLPFIKNAVINIGGFYILLAWFTVVGASNALNLTDGLDGLAVGCMCFITLTYTIMSYVTGHSAISGYLNVYYVSGAGELTVFCAALGGACLGFLWFNSYPAKIFMGDTGALSLGGAVAIVSVLIKKEVLLVLAGGVLILEAGSVILQVLGNKITGKRPFLMAPLHHHFQLKGMHESTITVRFWIIAAILAILSLASLKVR